MTRTIKLVQKDKTIKLTQNTPKIKLTQVTPKVVLKQVGNPGKPGEKGDKGDKGDTGLGIPSGGTPGQVLVKDGTEEYALKWQTPTFSGDKNAVLEFSVADVVAFSHNLNKYPAVSVIDSAGDEVEGSVEYVDTNSIVVSFNAPFSGRITCN